MGEHADFGFKRPKLEAFPGVPVRVTEEIPSQSMSQREPGTYIFDLGQNFAGTIRLRVTDRQGQRIQIRYGEMLHPDGRLMTENLRKARATDYYTCRGDRRGRSVRTTVHVPWIPVCRSCRTFPAQRRLRRVTGLVMHSDTPIGQHLRVQRPNGQSTVQECAFGPNDRTFWTCRPTARSVMNAWDGPVMRKPMLRPPPTMLTSVRSIRSGCVN